MIEIGNCMIFQVYNSFTQVKGDAMEHRLVWKALSYRDPGYEIAMRKVGRRWNGWKSVYDQRRKQFPSGLLPMVCEDLQKAEWDFDVQDCRVAPGKPSWPVGLSGVELRDYQTEAVTKFLNAGQGVLKMGTGAGKTEVAVAIAKSISQPMIFLTHRLNLMYQAAERFASRWPERKKDIGFIGDGHMSFRPLTFATVQSVHSAIKKYGDAALDELKRYRLMIIDEAHRVGSTQFNVCAKALVGAYWRLGLTATPFMSENPADNLHLLGAVGGVIYEVTSTRLIEEGFLARPYFKYHVINRPTGLRGLRNWRDIYEQGIVHNEFRNNVVVKNTTGVIELGYRPLVIVSEVAHGELLKDKLAAQGVACRFISGKDDVRMRVAALKALAKGEHQCLVCSTIFDEGIDVTEVSSVILAAGNKSAPALLQRTGRAVRKKKDRNTALVVDFIDRQHPVLERHSLQRYSLIKAEPGFAIL